jgi:hypothetical protein
VRGFGQLVIDDLQIMHCRHDGGPLAQQAGLDQQRHLDVGVAGTLSEPDATAVDSAKPVSIWLTSWWFRPFAR